MKQAIHRIVDQLRSPVMQVDNNLYVVRYEVRSTGVAGMKVQGLRENRKQSPRRILNRKQRDV